MQIFPCVYASIILAGLFLATPWPESKLGTLASLIVNGWYGYACVTGDIDKFGSIPFCLTVLVTFFSASGWVPTVPLEVFPFGMTYLFILLFPILISRKCESSN